MSDAYRLGPRPSVEHYRKLTKDLQFACRSGTVARWARQWAASLAGLDGVGAARIEQRWNQFTKTNQRAARCRLADAQLFIARGHGFASWAKFTAHLKGLMHVRSPVSMFEAAVDAIVSGDAAALESLLRENPELVRARSLREHRSTLLHYVSANGVEDFRQKTPPNIVEIAKLLLAAGADVNAESDAYAGRSTALGLAATSCHPEAAGVQLPLLDLLIGHGAIVDGPDPGSSITGCLHNGRAQAAEFLATRGARVDLEGAAGIGRLDLVVACFDSDGRLKPPATLKQAVDAFGAACGFGRTQVVEFLLGKGIAADAGFGAGGETGLHVAALGGHTAVVKLLVERGAAVDVQELTYQGTPLDWALYGWNQQPAKPDPAPSYECIALLARAGARLDTRQWDDPVGEPGLFGRIRSDPRMQAALRGESSGE